MKISYSFKWIMQRVTALFLIPFSFWFIYHCISFQNLTYFEFKMFFESFFNSTLFVLMMITMLIHAKLGCETIIQDYISTPTLNKICKKIINFFIIFLLFLVILAIFNLSIIQ